MTKTRNNLKANAKTRSSKRKNGQTNRRQLETGYPGPIKSQPIQVRCLRLRGTASSATNFSLLDLLTSFGVTLTTTTYAAIFGSVKINRITLTALPSSTEAGTVTFTWRGTRTPTEEIVFYYGNALPSKMSFKPPPESLADFWFSGNSSSTDTVETVWTILASEAVDILMDIEFSYIFVDGAGYTNTCSALAAGTLFASRMPRNTSNFTAVGITTNQIV